jgi:hypothetical protein
MERAWASVKQFVISPKPPPAWAWPVGMLLLGLGALVASLVFYPGGDEWTYIAGHRFGAGCTFLESTGHPCPSCGMTRSWVHLARGDVLRAFSYSPAGAILLLWLLFAGVLGAVRLVTRDHRRWQLPYNAVAGFALFWMIGPYMGLWVARLFGFLPLP